MRLAVIIATAGRKALVPRTLELISKQSRLPDIVVVSAPTENDAEPVQVAGLNMRYVYGRRGLTAQRNHALESVLPDCDIVTFFDDDFLPATGYLANVEKSFAAFPDWVAITGNVLADGICTAGLSFEQGLTILDEAAKMAEAEPERATKRLSAYGCNMSIRASAVGSLRFDERLVLYGWQEDVDFTAQLNAVGRVVGLSSAKGVHLGIKSGRVSGVRFGYSQIANPIYLVFKGTVPAWFAARIVLRNLAANLVKSVWPEPHVDRRGRLKGNVFALAHALRGRIDPQHVLHL